MVTALLVGTGGFIGGAGIGYFIGMRSMFSL